MAETATARLPARLPGGSGLQAIPGLRQIFTLVGIAAAVALGIAVALWSRSPSYTPLFTGLDERDASQVVQALQTTGDRFQLGPGGTSVLVAEGDVARLRLALAAQGLPQGAAGSSAEEAQTSPFGMSDFAEKARYQKRLEAELVSSIASLQPVKGARVHLALPKPSAFVRDRRPASASVVVTLFPGRNLDPSQVSAVVHLVASSVPDLDPSQVSVIDHKGNLLTAGGATDPAALADGRFRFAQSLEQAYAMRIEELLTPLVGPGRVRAQVAANMDFTETERTDERFDPKATVLRSEQMSNQERRDGSASAQGIPGALSNQPPPAAPQPTAADPNAGAGASANATASTAAAASPLESQSSATRNFEVDRSISHTREPVGSIRRLSVAVVVDNKVNVDENGDPQTTPLSQTELAQMMELVRGAVGFDESRGDTVSVINAPFHAEPDIEAPAAPPLWEQPAMREIGKQILGALVVLVLALMVVRPMLRGLVGAPASAGAALPVQVLAGASSVDQAGTAETPRALGSGMAMAALPPVAFEQKVTLAKRLVNQDPRQVAQVVKGWVAEDGS